MPSPNKCSGAACCAQLLCEVVVSKTHRAPHAAPLRLASKLRSALNKSSERHEPGKSKPENSGAEDSEEESSAKRLDACEGGEASGAVSGCGVAKRRSSPRSG